MAETTTTASNVKRYLVEHTETYFEMLVEIDHDKFTEAHQREINEFWSDSESRISAEGGNLLHAVLKLLSLRVMNLQVEYGFNTHGIVDLFDWDREFGNGGQEGWPKMDGTFGIKLLSVNDVEFAPSDMRVTEVPNA